MTSQASVGYKLPEYMKVYARTQEMEILKPFSKVPAKGDIKVYAVPDKHALMHETIGSVGAEYIMRNAYPAPSVVSLESVYTQLLLRRLEQQPNQRSEPMRESLSTLTPEIVGLGLGGVLSFGLVVFALATHNTGLATVMAGPFLASILGFALLLTGLKRKKQ